MKAATRLLHAGLAPATRANYVGPQRQFHEFAAKHGVTTPIPATEDLLCMWAASLAARVKWRTVRSYLYAVRSLHIEGGHGDPIEGRLRLARMLAGVHRLEGDRTRTTRLPVTTELVAIARTLHDTNNHDERCVMAACAAATAGMLRVGEVAAIESEPGRYLRYEDLVMGEDHFTITLRVSKTDAFGRGTRVVVAQQGAVRDMAAYLRGRPHRRPASPLFMLSDGTALRRRTLLVWTRTRLETGGVDASGHVGLSFRRGGATSLADSGTPDHVIMELGRWKSWVYASYIQSTLADLVAAAARM